MLSSQGQSLGVSYASVIDKLIADNKEFSTGEKELSRYITETNTELGIYTTYAFPKTSDGCEAIQINFTDIIPYNVYISNFAKDFKSITSNGVKKWYAHSNKTGMTMVIIPLELTVDDINNKVVGKIRITNLGSIYDK